MEEVSACEAGDEKAPYRLVATLKSVAIENSGFTAVDVGATTVAADAGVADLRSCLSSLVGLRSCCTWLAGMPVETEGIVYGAVRC